MALAFRVLRLTFNSQLACWWLLSILLPSTPDAFDTAHKSWFSPTKQTILKMEINITICHMCTSLICSSSFLASLRYWHELKLETPVLLFEWKKNCCILFIVAITLMSEAQLRHRYNYSATPISDGLPLLALLSADRDLGLDMSPVDGTSLLRKRDMPLQKTRPEDLMASLQYEAHHHPLGQFLLPPVLLLQPKPAQAQWWGHAAQCRVQDSEFCQTDS